MPLEHAKAGTPGFGRNVATEVRAGKPEEQAVAIAYSKARSDAAPTGKFEFFNYTARINPADGTGDQWVTRWEIHKNGRKIMGGFKSRAEAVAWTENHADSALDAALALADEMHAKADALSVSSSSR